MTTQDAWTPPQPSEPGGSFPLRRDNWDVGQVISLAWEAFKREWLMLCVALLIGVAVAFSFSLMLAVAEGLVRVVVGAGEGSESWAELARSDPKLLFAQGALTLGVTLFFFLVSFVLNTAVQGWVELGLARVCFDALAGRKVDLMRMLEQVRKVPSAFLVALFTLLVFIVVMLVAGVAVVLVTGVDFSEENLPRLLIAGGIALLVLIGPMVWFGIGVRAALLELAFSEEVLGPLEALSRGFRIVKGMRWWWILVALIGVVFALAGFLLCCVGVIPAAMLAQLCTCGAFLAFRQGSV